MSYRYLSEQKQLPHPGSTRCPLHLGAAHNVNAGPPEASIPEGPLGDAIRLYARDGLYRVHAGPYADAGQADRVAARIEQTIDIRPVVITR